MTSADKFAQNLIVIQITKYLAKQQSLSGQYELTRVPEDLPQHGDHDQVDDFAEGLVRKDADAARGEDVQRDIVQEFEELLN